MATLSIRIPDALKESVSEIALREGVSMNNFISSCLSAAVSQRQTLQFLARRLDGVDRVATKRAFEKLMSQTRPGPLPSEDEINAARGL